MGKRAHQTHRLVYGQLIVGTVQKHPILVCQAAGVSQHGIALRHGRGAVYGHDGELAVGGGGLHRGPFGEADANVFELNAAQMESEADLLSDTLDVEVGELECGSHGCRGGGCGRGRRVRWGGGCLERVVVRTQDLSSYKTLYESS